MTETHPQNRRLGYAVSTVGQTLDSQLERCARPLPSHGKSWRIPCRATVWSAILSGPAPPKGEAVPRPKESIWAVPLPHTGRKRPPDDRRQLLDMLRHLAPGDVVIVTRIDRLARSTFDLFAIVKQIVDAKAQFRSLAEPWADTGTSTGRLMMPFSAAWPMGCRKRYMRR
jgi:hypothetical protein